MHPLAYAIIVLTISSLAIALATLRSRAPESQIDTEKFVNNIYILVAALAFIWASYSISTTFRSPSPISIIPSVLAILSLFVLVIDIVTR